MTTTHTATDELLGSPEYSELRIAGPVLPTARGVRVGCDLVVVPRLAARLERTPALRDRLFLPGEVDDAGRGGAIPGSPPWARRLAARFAAKEAAYKALGIPGLAFLDVEVRTGPNGAPSLLVQGVRSEASVSLSHDGDLAFAVVAVPPAAIDQRAPVDHAGNVRLDLLDLPDLPGLPGLPTKD